jgi:hypothetical protein
MIDPNGGGSIISAFHFWWWGVEADWRSCTTLTYFAESRSQSKIEAFGHKEKLSRPRIYLSSPSTLNLSSPSTLRCVVVSKRFEVSPVVIQNDLKLVVLFRRYSINYRVILLCTKTPTKYNVLLKLSWTPLRSFISLGTVVVIRPMSEISLTSTITVQGIIYHTPLSTYLFQGWIEILYNNWYF